MGIAIDEDDDSRTVDETLITKAFAALAEGDIERCGDLLAEAFPALGTFAHAKVIAAACRSKPKEITHANQA